MTKTELYNIRVYDLQWSQTRLADESGMGNMMICNYETGKNPIPESKATIFRLLKEKYSSDGFNAVKDLKRDFRLSNIELCQILEVSDQTIRKYLRSSIPIEFKPEIRKKIINYRNNNEVVTDEDNLLKLTKGELNKLVDDRVKMFLDPILDELNKLKNGLLI